MADEAGENFGALHRRFDAVDAKLTVHDAKLDAIDAKLTVHGGKLAAHDRQFEQIALQFDEVFRRLAEQDAKRDAQFREILGHFDAVYHRLDRIEQEYLMITEGIRRLEAMLLDEQGKRELLERRLAGLKTDVTALQARIEALERRLQG